MTKKTATHPSKSFAGKKAQARFVCIALCACVTCSLVFLSACASVDKKKIQGEWKSLDSKYQITVVFTETEFKSPAGTMNYEIGSKNTITFTTSDGKEGKGTYAFNEDYSRLTFTQTNDNGANETTEFQKVSEDITSKPQASKK